VDLRRSPAGRRALFAALYFLEGAPIGYVWWALPVALARAGVGPARIGAVVALLVLPWALKFLWAPLVDVLRGPRFGLRGWIAASQAAMVLALLPLLWLDPLEQLGLLTLVLVAHAVAAATQDVAIDALAIASTGAHERGALNGWMQAGMLLGRSAFGGGALLLRERVGDQAVVVLLATTLAAGLLLHLAYRADEGAQGRATSWTARARGLALLLRALLASRRTWLALAFAASAGVAFETVGALAGPWLVSQGASDAAVGTFLAGPAVLGLGLGALAGGALADRLGRRRVVAAGGLATAAATASLALAAPGACTWLALGAVYLGAGLLTASSYALLMDLTDPRLGSTQFSAYMGATNLCEAWSSALGGRLAASRGWPAAFAAAAALGLVALPLLVLLPAPKRELAG
jgi:MFS family permease